MPTEIPPASFAPKALIDAPEKARHLKFPSEAVQVAATGNNYPERLLQAVANPD